MTMARPVQPAIAVPFGELDRSPSVRRYERKKEDFADGMAEEIINRLAQVHDLYLPARTAAFFFKDRRMAISDIASQLRVANVRTEGYRPQRNPRRAPVQKRDQRSCYKEFLRKMKLPV
jgi:TolB-like protein